MNYIYWYNSGFVILIKLRYNFIKEHISISISNFWKFFLLDKYAIKASMSLSVNIILLIFNFLAIRIYIYIEKMKNLIIEKSNKLRKDLLLSGSQLYT